MTYFSSSTGDGTSVQAQMRTTIPSNAAWSLVESTTFGSSYASDVYKCDHTVSGLSADFYMVVVKNSSGTLLLGIAEGYNTSTHKPQRPAMRATSALQPLQADGGILPATTEMDWYSGTYNPGGGSIGVATNIVSLGSVFSPYAIIVAKDAVVLVRSGLYGFAGAYDTSLGADDPLPIFVGMNTGAQCFATRHPRRGGLSTGYACNLNGVVSSEGGVAGSLAGAVPEANMTLQFAPGTAAGADGYDSYQSDFGASRVAILNSYVSGSATVGRYVNGWRRGWARHLRVTTSGGFADLDTLTIDGTAYVYASGVWIEKDPT